MALLCRGFLDRSRQQTGALIPLELALHQLKPDQGGGTQRLGFVDEFLETFLKRGLVDPLHRCVGDAEFDIARRPFA